jgi:glycosyltransferase involved in cell wall biosynthesis
LRAVLQEADAITACSRYLLDKAIQIEPAAAKGRVIHNGVDLERFHDKTPYRHPRPYLLAFGRLTYKKGFDMLLDAFAQLTLEHQQVDIILAGAGEERQSLQAQVERLGLAERVHFFGRADACEVVRLLNGCRFVIVPSRQEPFGIAALEALAAGKPVLATCVGGLAELVQGPGTRLVVPTAAALRDGLAQWLDRGPASDTIRAADRLEQHSWRHVVAQFEQMYAEETP